MSSRVLWLIVAILNIVMAFFNIKSNNSPLLITLNCIVALLALLLTMK